MSSPYFFTAVKAIIFEVNDILYKYADDYENFDDGMGLVFTVINITFSEGIPLMMQLVSLNLLIKERMRLGSMGLRRESSRNVSILDNSSIDGQYVEPCGS